MTEEELHANPERLISLADDLRDFVNGIITEMGTLDNGLKSLGTTWQDEGYEKFKQLVDRSKTEIEHLSEEIKKREPELREDALLLFNYLKKAPDTL